jgi:Ca2+/Na+ antiporter
MLTFRLYIALLTLVFLFLVLADNRFGVLAGIVVTCSFLFLILDIRKDVNDIKRLEAQIASLQNGA